MLTFTQIKQLSKYMNCKPSELNLEDFDFYDYYDANITAKEYIQDYIGTFNPKFISRCTNIAEDIIKDMQRSSDFYNDCSIALSYLIEATCGWDKFVKDALIVNGRGYFLSPYDGQEIELISSNGNIIYAYRNN